MGLITGRAAWAIRVAWSVRQVKSKVSEVVGRSWGPSIAVMCSVPKTSTSTYLVGAKSGLVHEQQAAGRACTVRASKAVHQHCTACGDGAVHKLEDGPNECKD